MFDGFGSAHEDFSFGVRCTVLGEKPCFGIDLGEYDIVWGDKMFLVRGGGCFS